MSKKAVSIIGVFSLIALIIFLTQPAVGWSAPQQAEGVTMRISIGGDGTEANNHAFTPSMTANGDYVTFISGATNLHPDATNGMFQAFIKERQSGQIMLASVSGTGEAANNNVLNATIAANGRFVVFDSLATNLITGTVNNWIDVFVHDTQLLTTTQVSIAADGSPGNHTSQNPDISADGRYVVFQSNASNLVSGDLSFVDVFVHDRDTDNDGLYDEPGNVNTILVSTAANGSPGNGPSTDPVISANGRFVVYTSSATNLVPNDTNDAADVFLYDRDADENGIYDEPGGIAVTLISIGADGSAANNISYAPAISPDGSQVAFESLANNLIPGGTMEFIHHVYARDWQAGVTTLISQSSDGAEANDGSSRSAFSGNGRFVAFESPADNLVPGDTNFGNDIFLRDRDVDQDGIFDEPGQVATIRLSVDSGGNQSDGQASNAAISADGSLIAFDSDASDLVPGDTNFTSDVFLHDRQIAPPTGADLSVTITGPGAVLGRGASYLVTVQNAGPETAVNATMSRSITSNDSTHWGQPSQGTCFFSSCEFGDIFAAGQITMTASGSVSENQGNVYIGSVNVYAHVSADTSDPNLTNNTASFATHFYNCAADNQCILDEVVCYLFKTFPPTPTSSSRNESQSLVGQFIPQLALYYQVRDGILTTTAGSHYKDLYYTHSDELSDLLFADTTLWDTALATLAQWEPNLHALVNDEGETAVITAAQVQSMDDFLNALSAAGSPALQQTIANERANLPPLTTFVGMTMAEARGQIIGYTTYLPLVTGP
ncbi:MAG: PD40 domain-containing protein [Anaerolineales bacterium]|nr:PD40 domain-containing protein [Anaerolineales bacterium]